MGSHAPQDLEDKSILKPLKQSRGEENSEQRVWLTGAERCGRDREVSKPSRITEHGRRAEITAGPMVPIQIPLNHLDGMPYGSRASHRRLNHSASDYAKGQAVLVRSEDLHDCPIRKIDLTRFARHPQ